MSAVITKAEALAPARLDFRSWVVALPPCVMVKSWLLVKVAGLAVVPAGS